MKAAKLALIGITLFVILTGYFAKKFLDDTMEYYTNELTVIGDKINNQQVDEASTLLDNLKKDWNEKRSSVLEIYVHHGMVDNIYQHIIALSVTVEEGEFSTVNEIIALLLDGIDVMRRREVLSLSNIF